MRVPTKIGWSRERRTSVTRPPSRSNLLSESLNDWLSSYAAAASAAGVSLLALSQSADAKIVYTPAHITIGYGGVQSYNLDLNCDGATDFVMSTVSSCDIGGCFFDLGAFPEKQRSGDGIEFKGSSDSAAALYRGAAISHKQNFNTCCFVGLAAVYYSTNGHRSVKGHWVNVRNRYLGLKFQIKGKTHFGWARLTVNVQGKHITAKLTGYAYETIPNKPIIAGNTKGTEDTSIGEQPKSRNDVPRPGTLGELAAGSPGLFADKCGG
jgi:hypothetical protein